MERPPLTEDIPRMGGVRECMRSIIGEITER